MDSENHDKLTSAVFASGQTQEIVNKGLSQTFDYGIGMTVLTLFLFACIALCIWLLRFFLKYIKDSIKQAADNYALAQVLNVQLTQIGQQYQNLILLISQKFSDKE